jgi:hypothetical protein
VSLISDSIEKGKVERDRDEEILKDILGESKERTEADLDRQFEELHPWREGKEVRSIASFLPVEQRPI